MSAVASLFVVVLNMSITASFVAAGVLLVRQLLRPAPKIFSYALWSVVLFRLLCPVSFAAPFSLFDLFRANIPVRSGALEPIPPAIGLAPVPAVSTGLAAVDRIVNRSLPAAVPQASANPLQIWLAVGSIIWLAGLLTLLCANCIACLKLASRLRTATRVRDNIFASDQIDTAFVFGYLHPRIYVPAGVGSAELPYILAHERTHLRRGDYWLKLLAFLAVAVHWFNPFAWLYFSLLQADMEMACDESVLRRIGGGEVGPYSGSLLAMAVQRSGLQPFNTLAFGESHIKTRIMNALNYKKPAVWMLAVSLIIVFAVVAGFAANPYGAGRHGYFRAYVRWGEKGDNSPVGGATIRIAGTNTVLTTDSQGLTPPVSLPVNQIEAATGEMIGTYTVIVSAPGAVALEYRAVHVREGTTAAAPTILEAFLRRGSGYAIIPSGEGTGSAPQADIRALVEENLAAIMSSPLASSSPQDYIAAHQDAYENIIKYGGEDALAYMLGRFADGDTDGLRGQLMMRLCQQILGARNNVADASLSPQNWYAALSIRPEVTLPDFTYTGDDPVARLVYATEIERHHRSQAGFTVVAAKVFGSYPEGGRLKVFVTAYSATYRLYGSVLSLEGASVVPAAITYRRDASGAYILDKYEAAQDGSGFVPSIRRFCTLPDSGKEIAGLADAILAHYQHYDDLVTLQYANLRSHLLANGQTDVTLLSPIGEVIFSLRDSQSNP